MRSFEIEICDVLLLGSHRFDIIVHEAAFSNWHIAYKFIAGFLNSWLLPALFQPFFSVLLSGFPCGFLRFLFIIEDEISVFVEVSFLGIGGFMEIFRKRLVVVRIHSSGFGNFGDFLWLGRLRGGKFSHFLELLLLFDLSWVRNTHNWWVLDQQAFHSNSI